MDQALRGTYIYATEATFLVKGITSKKIMFIYNDFQQALVRSSYLRKNTKVIHYDIINVNPFEKRFDRYFGIL